MRKFVILGGIGILCAVVWTMAAAESASGQRSGGHGGAGHGGHDGSMRHGGGHQGGHSGMMWSSELDTRPRLLYVGETGPVAAFGTPASVLRVGEPEHGIPGHLMGPAFHPLAHVPLRLEQGVPAVPQAEVSDASGSDQTDATTPPNPTASPLQSRPPGAAGPGRPVFGQSGPGLPGPGRSASPRW